MNRDNWKEIHRFWHNGCWYKVIMQPMSVPAQRLVWVSLARNTDIESWSMRKGWDELLKRVVDGMIEAMKEGQLDKTRAATCYNRTVFDSFDVINLGMGKPPADTYKPRQPFALVPDKKAEPNPEMALKRCALCGKSKVFMEDWVPMNNPCVAVAHTSCIKKFETEMRDSKLLPLPEPSKESLQPANGNESVGRQNDVVGLPASAPVRDDNQHVEFEPINTEPIAGDKFMFGGKVMDLIRIDTNLDWPVRFMRNGREDGLKLEYFCGPNPLRILKRKRAIPVGVAVSFEKQEVHNVVFAKDDGIVEKG